MWPVYLGGTPTDLTNDAADICTYVVKVAPVKRLFARCLQTGRGVERLYQV